MKNVYLYVKREFSLTSLLMEGGTQEPVTVNLINGEPLMKQDRFSYLMSSLSFTGVKVTSKGKSLLGQIYPFTGLIDNSAGKSLVCQ